jgi:hypothetical protein
MTTEIDPEEVVAQVSERLHEKFPDTATSDIDAAVRAELAEFIDRPVQDYLAVLTERGAKKRLKRVDQPA